MTPRNPLDGKVIIHKSHLAALCAMTNPLYQAQSDTVTKAMRLLDQDLTGWAATLVNPDRKMLAKCVQGYDPIQTASVERNHQKMLEASPPLPGGGE